MAAALHRTMVATLVAASGIFIAGRPASDWVGVYGVIDRVVIEPDTLNPKTIQIWGVFALAQTPFIDANGGVTADLNAYYPAQRGYLYYSSEGVDARGRNAFAEWADLRSVAGTGVPVGFGARFMGVVRAVPNAVGRPAVVPRGAPAVQRVRRPSEPPANPAPYRVGLGVVELHPGAGGVIRDVLGVPDPVSPADGDQVAPGRVELVTRNIRETAASYVFEIEDARGLKEMSPAIPAGKGQTSWTPKLSLVEGEQYTWRVVANFGDWRGQPAVSIFRAKKP